MIKDNIGIIALLALIISLLAIAVVCSIPANNKYHCHAKNHKLYESIEPDGNVFLKGTEDCIDIRDVKRFTTSVKEIKK